MNINILDCDKDTLVNILYLGKWIVNATRLPKQRLKDYDNVFVEIINQIEKEGCIFEDKAMHDRVEELICKYNADILFQELAKQYSNYIYPVEMLDYAKDRDKAIRQFTANTVLRNTCEEQLNSQGLRIIKISLPGISQKIEEEVQKSINLLK